jgi:hypothetical protein
MAIKTPIWAKRAGAFPTTRGWEVNRPKGRTEVIRSATFSAADIAEWHGESVPAPVPAPAPAPAPEPVVQTLHEAPVEEHEVSDEEVDWHYGDDEDDS